MPKGADTKSAIAAAAAPLFNQRGFAGTSMSDIMAATGLRKGAIYNHFASKDDIALAALEHGIGLIRARLDTALEGKESARDRLNAIASVFASHVDDPLIPGGCPLFNTAADGDDSHPALSEKAREALDRWHTLVKGTVRKGIARGELRAGADADAFATLFIAALEGGIVLSRMHGDDRHMRRIREALEREIDRMAA